MVNACPREPAPLVKPAKILPKFLAASCNLTLSRKALDMSRNLLVTLTSSAAWVL